MVFNHRYPHNDDQSNALPLTTPNFLALCRRLVNLLINGLEMMADDFVQSRNRTYWTLLLVAVSHRSFSTTTEFSQEVEGLQVRGDMSGHCGEIDGACERGTMPVVESFRGQLDQPLSADREAMQLYLIQRHCSRGILSQFLDGESDWRSCMEDDELCGVCSEHHRERRPPGLQFHLPT